MKKPLIVMLIAVAFITACKDEPQPDLTERERRIKAEQELDEQRMYKERWQLVAGLCATGCVIFLIVGSAAGSKAKRDAARR